MEQNQPAADERGASTFLVEIVVAAILILVGVVVMSDSLRVGAGWGADGPGPGYFPFYIGLVITVASAVTLIQTLVRARLDRAKKTASIFVTKGQFKLVLSVLIPTTIYVLLIPWLGLYVPSALFIGAFMWWLGGYRLTIILPVAIGVPVGAFLLFDIWFLLPMPKGPVEALLGF